MPCVPAINESILSICKDKKWLNICFQYYLQRNDMFLDKGKPWEISYNDLFLQGHSEQNPIVSGFLLAICHYEILHNNAFIAPIDVGLPPHQDKFDQENNAILNEVHNNYPDVVAFVKSGHGDYDGLLEIEDKLRVPLEVGYSEPATLYFHLSQSKGFARWGYESKYIYVLSLKSKETNEISITLKKGKNTIKQKTSNKVVMDKPKQSKVAKEPFVFANRQHKYNTGGRLEKVLNECFKKSSQVLLK